MPECQRQETCIDPLTDHHFFAFIASLSLCIFQKDYKGCCPRPRRASPYLIIMNDWRLLIVVLSQENIFEKLPGVILTSGRHHQYPGQRKTSHPQLPDFLLSIDEVFLLFSFV